MEEREKAVKALKTVFSEEHARILEKQVTKFGVDITEYKRIIYQIIGVFIKEKSNATVINMIKNKKVGWESDVYNEHKKRQEEYDEYIQCPFEISEGVVKCDKCGQSRTYSFQKQVRSGDEPMTTFSICINCGHNWAT